MWGMMGLRIIEGGVRLSGMGWRDKSGDLIWEVRFMEVPYDIAGWHLSPFTAFYSHTGLHMDFASIPSSTGSSIA
jgi:hypothetical protein